MPHNQHAHDKAHACQEALEHFEQDHHRRPDAHEKAHLISHTIQEWEKEEVVLTHPGGTVSA